MTNTDPNYQEARAIYHNLSLAIDKKNWDLVSKHTSRLGDLVMRLGREEA